MRERLLQVFLLLPVLLACRATGTAATEVCILEEVLAKHQAVVDAMDCWEVEAQWNGTIGGAPLLAMQGTAGQRLDSAALVWKKCGDFRYVLRDSHAEVPETGWQQSVASLFVVNEDHVLEVADINARLITRYERHSEELAAILKPKIHFHTLPHLDKFGFGVVQNYLSEDYYEMYRDHEEWRCETFREGDVMHYRITRDRSRNNHPPIEYVIDAESYLVTRVAVYRDMGRTELEAEVQIELQQLPGGEWFPLRVAQQRPTWSETISIERVRVLQDAPTSHFSENSIPALVEGEWQMVHVGEGHSRQPYVFENGEWVPWRN